MSRSLLSKRMMNDYELLYSGIQTCRKDFSRIADLLDDPQAMIGHCFKQTRSHVAGNTTISKELIKRKILDFVIVGHLYSQCHSIMYGAVQFTSFGLPHAFISMSTCLVMSGLFVKLLQIFKVVLVR
jgi:hypothetical protein